MDKSPLSLDEISNSQDYNFLEQLSNADFFNLRHEDTNFNDSPYSNIDVQCKYYDETQYTSIFNNVNAFTYMSFNIQSLTSKFLQFQEMIQILIDHNCAPDIILLQEIWKNPDPTLFNLKDYSFISKSRSTAQGGGVGIYIKSTYHFNVLNSYSIFIDRIFESLFIEVWLSKSKKIIIGNIYRPSVNHPVITTNEQFLQFIDLFSNT